MPIRLNCERLFAAAAVLGDTSHLAIRERTGISLGTFSRLVNRQVEPSVRNLNILSVTYDVPVGELYEEVAESVSEAVA
jgi:transcriptional regulator with XRE-family HTH domain